MWREDRKKEYLVGTTAVRERNLGIHNRKKECKIKKRVSAGSRVKRERTLLAGQTLTRALIRGQQVRDLDNHSGISFSLFRGIRGIAVLGGFPHKEEKATV